MDITYLANKFLASGTVLSQVFILLAVVYMLFYKKSRFSWPLINDFFKFASKKGILFSFIVALVAALGSFFYSQFVGFPPCNLCWFQRIFMYPLVFLLGLALIKKDSGIVDYVLIMSGVGFLLSLYHNYIYYNQGGLYSLCQFLGAGESCLKRYVFEFNYITIPLMSLTAFTLIIVLLYLHKMQGKKS